MTLAEKRQEVWDKIINLHAENIQITPPIEYSPVDGAGSTEGFISKQYKTIFGTKTDKRGRTIYVGTKGDINYD